MTKSLRAKTKIRKLKKKKKKKKAGILAKARKVAFM